MGAAPWRGELRSPAASLSRRRLRRYQIDPGDQRSPYIPLPGNFPCGRPQAAPMPHHCFLSRRGELRSPAVSLSRRRLRCYQIDPGDHRSPLHSIIPRRQPQAAPVPYHRFLSRRGELRSPAASLSRRRLRRYQIDPGDQRSPYIPLPGNFPCGRPQAVPMPHHCFLSRRAPTFTRLEPQKCRRGTRESQALKTPLTPPAPPPGGPGCGRNGQSPGPGSPQRTPSRWARPESRR